MAGRPFYRDYTELKHHNERMWTFSDSVSLPRMGFDGLDIRSAAVAGGVGMVAAAVVYGITALLPINFPATVFASVAFLVTTGGFYYWLLKDDLNATPVALLQRSLARKWQPEKYARAVDADFTADEIQWQIIFWRPDWANVRIGPIRRWSTYDPAPISDDVRQAIDPTGAGDLVGWTRMLATNPTTNG